MRETELNVWNKRNGQDSLASRNKHRRNEEEEKRLIDVSFLGTMCKLLPIIVCLYVQCLIVRRLSLQIMRF